MANNQLGTLTFKAIIKPELIKHFDLPGPMVRIKINEQVEFYFTPEQAMDAAIKLLNLAAVARDAQR